jgi:hypothetical protein
MRRQAQQQQQQQQQHSKTADLAHNASQQQQLNRLVETYLENAISTKDEYELEVRFGTRGIRGVKPIMRRDHEKVIEKLLSEGYACTRTDDYHLRIQCAPEPPNPKVSSIRVEINGRANVQEYCKTNKLNVMQTIFNKKTGVYINDVMVPPINFDDFNFRVSLQKEHRLRYESAEIRALSAESEWSKMKKTFRYIKRTSFEHPNLPLRIDISAIKESHRKEGSWQMEAEYNFATSKVTESALKYEIEIEVLNARVGPGKFINSAPVLAHALRGAIKLILSGLQGTNFPISYPEMQTVYNEYYHLLHYKDARDRRGGGGGGGSGDSDQSGDDFNFKVGGDNGRAGRDRGRDRDNVRLFPRDFIGPSSVTLQKFNLADIDIASYDENSKPNIRFNYTVTDKADGQRKMLFVNRLGRMYLIDTAMNVQFTGAVCIDEKLHYTLIDGEHILHDKTGRFINLYAAFDIYYIRKIDIRHLAFATNNRMSAESNFRLYHLREFMRDSSATFRSVVVPAAASGGAFSAAPIRLTVKRFEIADNGGPYDIFRCCSNVLNGINDGCFEYNTDGLIFTPANTGVCVSKVGIHAPLEKLTWPRSFKWKPVEHNTIDFMVTTEKHHDQSDIVKKSYSEGEIFEYKTLTLRVGYSVERDGYLNPMSTAIDLPNDNSNIINSADVAAFADPDAASAGNAPANSKYNKQQQQHQQRIAAPFYPTIPPDDTAHICNIRLKNSGGVYQMLTESGEDSFADRAVVEFRYDAERPAGWRWIPIKVRHDKTLAKEMGNAFHVANDNWFSIHNPLTDTMLRTGANIFLESVVESDAYYNRSPVIRDGDRLRDTSSMQPLRDFHNLFVKRALISAVCRPGSTLIDLAVGKAGDIHKWAHAELSAVFGIDIAEDNIRNRQDGAYARYLTLRRNNLMKSVPYMAFIRADSGKPIRTSETDAYESSSGSGSGSGSASLYKAIADTIFGAVDRPDPNIVGRAVAQHYAVGKDGFDVCSVQFAMHYFWKDVATLHTFLRNVSETTKVGGHFIGTCYDGRRVYKMLLNERPDDPVSLYDDAGRRVWSISRQYPFDKRDKKGGTGGYLDDETSIGYAIDVYQESINKTHREYLVNAVYLTRLMENYGFVLVPKAEAEQEYHLPNSMGSFQELFRLMASEISATEKEKHDYWLAPKMNDTYHSTISFLNNYFIFKKERQVDAKSVSEAFIKNQGLHEAMQEHLTVSVSDIVDASKGVNVVKAPEASAAAAAAAPKPKPAPRPKKAKEAKEVKEVKESKEVKEAKEEMKADEVVAVAAAVEPVVAKKRKYTIKAKPDANPPS